MDPQTTGPQTTGSHTTGWDATGWLPEATELAAYEGLRRGDERAFRLLAEALQPTLRRLACLYVTSDGRADRLLVRTWREALRGLGMFRWQSPLATWIARITVATGRAHENREVQPVTAPVAPRIEPASGPRDWSDIPWAARWDHAGETLREALASLPTPELEVIHGRDVEQWPARRVCDVFGLTEESYTRLINGAHGRLHRELATLIGEGDPGSFRDAQIAAVSEWLGQRGEHRPEPLDPRVVAVFRRWSTGRRGLSLLRRRPPAGARGPLPDAPGPSPAEPTAPRSPGRAAGRSGPG